VCWGLFPLDFPHLEHTLKTRGMERAACADGIWISLDFYPASGSITPLFEKSI
jgi:hypothetical protein